jgi:hypothetical protein
MVAVPDAKQTPLALSETVAFTSTVPRMVPGTYSPTRSGSSAENEAPAYVRGDVSFAESATFTSE